VLVDGLAPSLPHSFQSAGVFVGPQRVEVRAEVRGSPDACSRSLGLCHGSSTGGAGTLRLGSWCGLPHQAGQLVQPFPLMGACSCPQRGVTEQSTRRDDRFPRGDAPAAEAHASQGSPPPVTPLMSVHERSVHLIQITHRLNLESKLGRKKSNSN
jgi:hypothetical protein